MATTASGTTGAGAPPATTGSGGGALTLQGLARIEPNSTEALYLYAKTANKITEMLALDLDTTERRIVAHISGSRSMRRFGLNLRASARRSTRRLRKAADLVESASRELARFPRDYEREFDPLIHPANDGKDPWVFAENGKRGK